MSKLYWKCENCELGLTFKEVCESDGHDCASASDADESDSRMSNSDKRQHEIVKIHGYDASIGYKSYKGQWELGSAPGIHGWTPQDVLDYLEFWNKVSERLTFHNRAPTAPENQVSTVCQCGHERSAHIYEEGACRPGFKCEQQCDHYAPEARVKTE